MQPRSQAVRDLGDAPKETPWAPVRTRVWEIAAFFGDLTLVDPRPIDGWDWQPDSGGVAAPSSDVMTLLGALARRG